MKKPMISAIAALLIAGKAFAQTGVVQDSYIGCVTEEDLDNLVTSLSREDERLFDSLMGTVCAPVKGLPFSILDRGFVTSRIRVYVGDSHIDLWVPSEATR